MRNVGAMPGGDQQASEGLGADTLAARQAGAVVEDEALGRHADDTLTCHPR